MTLCAQLLEHLLFIVIPAFCLIPSSCLTTLCLQSINVTYAPGPVLVESPGFPQAMWYPWENLKNSTPSDRHLGPRMHDLVSIAKAEFQSPQVFLVRFPLCSEKSAQLYTADLQRFNSKKRALSLTRSILGSPKKAHGTSTSANNLTSLSSYSVYSHGPITDLEPLPGPHHIPRDCEPCHLHV